MFFHVLKAEAKGLSLQSKRVFVLYLFRDYKPTTPGVHTLEVLPLILSMLSISDGLCALRLLILVKCGFLLSCTAALRCGVLAAVPQVFRAALR